MLSLRIQQSSLLLLLISLTLISSATLKSGQHKQSSNNSTTTRNDYELLANSLLRNATKQMQQIWARKRDIFISSTKKSYSQSIMNQGPMLEQIDNDYHRLVYDLAGNLSIIPVAQLNNETLQRQVRYLSKLQLYGLEKKQYDNAKELLRTMKNFLIRGTVCLKKNSANCNTPMTPMIPNIMSHVMHATKYEDLEYYWIAWRQALKDKDAKMIFVEYVKALRMAATYNGHVTPSRTWYLNYETANFQRELEDVIWEMMPLYKEFHAYLRAQVRLYYGNRITPIDGAIPHSVLEQLIQQAWQGFAFFKVPYEKAHLPNLQPAIQTVVSDGAKLNKLAADYFESLELNHMSQGFYDKYTRLIPNPQQSNTECKAEVFYFPPDVALRYCSELSYKKLMQMHGHMAELQYNLYLKELPFGLDHQPCPGFGAAISETVVVASGTPRHLHRLNILSNSSLTDEQAMNRLFRMAVHTLLAIPQYFINEKFLVDVLDGRIAPTELNCGYWALQYKYAGVTPPKKRSEDNFDVDWKFYRGLNPEKPNTEKFLAEVLGYQFYRSFCLASEQYRPGDPDYPLHNCDFYGDERVGSLIRNMMKMGAKKHWREVMQITTQEIKLTAKGILEYFAPLYTWLKEYNKNHNLEPGWDSDINCDND